MGVFLTVGVRWCGALTDGFGLVGRDDVMWWSGHEEEDGNSWRRVYRRGWEAKGVVG